MNKLPRKTFPLVLTALATSTAHYAMAVEPTSGAYVTDTQNTWVQDRVGDRIGTVNMIMCIMSSLRPDAKVNQGAYVALVDQNKCEGRGDSSKSTSTSAGASNATNYMSSVVLATQASESAPLIVKAWLHDEQDDGSGPQKMSIYAYIVATAGKSETNPNGLFSMYFCGVPDGLSTCMFKGTLKSDSTGISFYQEESGGGGGPSMTRLKLLSNPNNDTGAGRISGTEGGNPYAYSFAYDPSAFRRDDGTVDACFDRDQSAASYSTWRYGTYQADGSRMEIDNPGFPVKYTVGGDTYFGFWSFWGLWLPESALATVGSSGTLTRRVGSSDVTLTPVRKGGKLWKLTRHTSSLDDFKNASMMFWASNNIGSGPSQLQAGHNYELQWDGSLLKAVGEQVCSGGQCSPQPLGTPITVLASTLVAAGVNALPVFFPSGGGNGAVVVPPAGAFASGTQVFYRTREVVSPSDGAAPGTLHCVNMCPKSGSTLTSAFSTSPVDPYLTQVWGSTASTQDYTYAAGLLSGTDGTVDASAIAKSTLGQYQWGLTTGSMVAAADINSIKCDLDGTPNTAGSYYCASLVDKAATIYQWETGPNQWNQYFGASGVTIDPPKSLSFAASSSPANIRAVDISKYDGSTVQLQFSGFGELQGIPGGCVDPDTNMASTCDQNKRWVPAFDILDGATVSDGSDTFYVKYLEREMRLGNMTCTGGSPSLSSAAGLSLPTLADYDVDPYTTLGSEPTPTDTKPAVIDGIVQVDS